MTKEIMNTIYATLNAVEFENKPAVMEALEKELHRNDRVKAEKEAAYIAAKPVVLEALRIAEKPATVAEIFNEEKNRKVSVCWGSVRVAFISSDYVVKYDYDENDAKRFGGCEDEEEFYNFAKEKGFEYLFAEITSFKYMNRIFYVMPRINMRMSQEGGRAEYYLDGAERDFVDEYLYDLHDENFGWKNNHPVIFDYAFNVFMEQKNYNGR